MRKCVFVLAMLAACSAMAATAWMDAEKQQVSWFRPDVCTAGGTTYAAPTDELLAKAFIVVEYDDCAPEYRVVSWNPPSVRAMTAQEIADYGAAAAAAQAEAEAYADPEPAVFVPRVDGSVTNVVGVSQIFIDAQTGAAFGVDETGSPEHTLAQKEAQNAKREALKAAASKAKKSGNLQQRIAALEDLLGIEE